MTNAVEVIQFSLNILLLLAFWQYLWRPYSVDVFRQNLFTLRNELFDLAASGETGLGFTSKEYILLRRWIHSTIRLAEAVEFVRLFIPVLLVRDQEEPKNSLVDAIDSAQDDELKAKLNVIRAKCGLEMFMHLLRTSPLMWVAALIIGFFVFVSQVIRFQGGLIRHVTTRMNDLQERLTSVLVARIDSEDKEATTLNSPIVLAT